MHVEQTPAVTPFAHGNDTQPAIACVEHTHFSVVHERLAFHELKQVSLNVRTDDTVGFDYCTRFRISIVPGPADLGLQPALQWPEQILQSLALGVTTFDAFELWQKFIRQVGPSSVFARSGIPARAFNDDFVHVWSHDVLAING
jgi:hypothetical protein